MFFNGFARIFSRFHVRFNALRVRAHGKFIGMVFGAIHLTYAPIIRAKR